MSEQLTPMVGTNELNDLMCELELVPIARAMVGMDIAEARKIRPAWCLRPESMKAYITLSKVDDEQIMSSFTEFMTTDAYMMRAVRNVGSDVSTANIGIKMYNGWVKRTEQFYITKILQTSKPKEKLAYANAIKALYHQLTPEVYIIDMANPSPPADFLMTYEGVDYRPRGDLSIIKAKKKSGKSTFLKIEIAAMISPTGKVNGMSRTNIPGTDTIREPYNVLWVDTEQSFASSDKCYRQVLQLAGLPTDRNDPHLRMINQRMSQTETRLSRVEEEVELSQYDVVVLDGVKDVAKDINDPQETDNIISRILQLIQDYKVSFITVIHENPSKDNDKMRGWLGTELGNKGFEIQEIANNQDTGVYTVTNPDRREKTIPPYGFRYNDEEILEQCEPEIKGSAGSGPQRIPKEEKDWNQFTKAYEQDYNVSLTQEEIVQNLLAIGMSETTIKRRIKAFEAKHKIISYESGGTIRYGISPAEKGKIMARLQGMDDPIISANDPIWTQAQDDAPF